MHQLDGQVQRPGGGHGGQDMAAHVVRRVAADARARGRRHGKHLLRPAALRQHHALRAGEDHAAAARAVGGERGVLLVQAEEQHFAVAVFGQRQHGGVIGIEHGRARGQHHIDLRARHAGHLLRLAHVVLLQAFVRGHGQHHAHLAAVVRQPFGQDVAGRGFKHGGLHGAVDEHALASVVTARVAFGELARAQKQPFLAGQRGAQPVQVQPGRHQARRERRRAAAQHAHDGDAAAFAQRKQVLHDGLAHGRRVIDAGAQVHPQIRPGMHAHDHALAGQGRGQVLRHQVHASNVQPRHAHGQRGQRGGAGVNLRRGVAAVLRAVGFGVARGGHHPAAGHQQAAGVAGNEFLDDHVIAQRVGGLPGGHDLLARGKVQRQSALASANGGFDGDGQADVFGGFPGVFGAVGHAAFGHGNARAFEQAAQQVFVARDARCNGAGAVRGGGPDAALRRAVPELHQIALVQADAGNAARQRRVHDAGGAGGKAALLAQRLQPGDGGGHVIRRAVDGGHDQIARRFQRQAAHGFVKRADHHFVDRVLARHAGFAEGGVHARLHLQLQRHVLHHVAGPGAFAQALQEAAALAHAALVFHQPRQPGRQALVVAGDGVGGEVFQLADIEHRLDDGAVSPHAGAAHPVHAQNLHIGEFSF